MVIGIDIGATKIAGGLVSEDGLVLEEFKFATPQDPNEAVKLITDKVRNWLDKGVQAVGIGAPGPTNLPRWRNFPLKKRLNEVLGLPVALENDSHAALLGELWQGAGKGKDRLMMLTLGSGVGGALWRDGKLWQGSDGHGAELGHTIIDPNFNGSCQAGHRGCLEAMVGGWALKQRYGKDVKTLFSDRIFVSEWTINLKRGLTKLIAEHQPKIVIIGGGVSNDAALFMPKLQDLGAPVVKAELGPKAGMVGAAYLATSLLATNY